MSEVKFGLYRVDRRYLGCLKQGGKVREITADLYCGPVISVGSLNNRTGMFVPAAEDFLKEFPDGGMAALDFGMMIPVPDDLLTEEKEYPAFAEFCAENRNGIVGRAEAVHKAACGN